MFEHEDFEADSNQGNGFEIYDDLDDSLPLNLYLNTDSQDYWDAIEHLYGVLQLSKHYKEARYRTLGYVILNLFYIYESCRADWVAFSRSPNTYSAKNRYNPLGISFRTLDTVADALISNGFVDFHKGVYFKSLKRTARMRASPLLIEWFTTNHRIFNASLVQNAIEPELIILKDSKKKKIEYAETEFTEEKRVLLQRYNDLLKKNFIDISLKGVDWAKFRADRKKNLRCLKFDVLNKRSFRVFNNSSFGEGGRFFGGWWQNVPSEFRSRIVINNKPTVEYDFKAIHVVLLYALNGIDYFGTYGDDVDPYLDRDTITSFEVTADQREIYRSLFKVTFMCCINSSSRKEAKKALTNSVRKDSRLKALKPDIDKALDCFERQHTPVKDHFYSCVGLKLMNLDSKLAEAVIRHFTEVEKLPILCVHDSFVCVKRDDDILVKILNEVLNKETLGDEIQIQITSLFKLKPSSLLRYRAPDDDVDHFVSDDLEELAKSHDIDLEGRFQSWVKLKKQIPFKVKL